VSRADHSSRGVVPNVVYPMCKNSGPCQEGHDPESGRSVSLTHTHTHTNKFIVCVCVCVYIYICFSLFLFLLYLTFVFILPPTLFVFLVFLLLPYSCPYLSFSHFYLSYRISNTLFIFLHFLCIFFPSSA